jgi:hypothetical protein
MARTAYRYHDSLPLVNHDVTDSNFPGMAWAIEYVSRTPHSYSPWTRLQARFQAWISVSIWDTRDMKQSVVIVEGGGWRAPKTQH